MFGARINKIEIQERILSVFCLELLVMKKC